MHGKPLMPSVKRTNARLPFSGTPSCLEYSNTALKQLSNFYRNDEVKIEALTPPLFNNVLYISDPGFLIQVKRGNRDRRPSPVPGEAFDVGLDHNMHGVICVNADLVDMKRRR